ncbi:TMV resistance protein N-like [Fagus crenata]
MASMSTENASSSSSSSSTPPWKYDAFLSFRGEDTRNNFTDHLYCALKQKGIFTFRDDEKLERGKSISLELLKAIEESRFAIVIFSRNYASSTWCLDEFTEIVGCMKEKGMTVLPVFYNVDPSDVRKQAGTFGEAFDVHEERFKENIEKVQKWRDALKEVANIAGWTLPANGPETKVIQEIVDVISNKLGNMFSVDTKELIGINTRVEKLMSHLAIGSSKVHVIGIWGPGGMGKTTLARVVYERVSNQYEARSFITDVRENSEKYGLVQLQKRLLSELLNERDVNIYDVGNGVLMIKKRLRHKKILLVLDDVNESDQLEKLAGKNDWFGPGSRVIITTRNKHLLVKHEVNETYEVEALTNDDSFQLFSLKAFKKDHPPEDYVQLSQAFVLYSKGLPLALEILGSFLFKRSMDEWKSELDRLKEFPDRKIINVLKISFDGLQEAEREIFLNIACFFNHQPQDRVKKILDYLKLYPEIGFRVLIDKSLLKIEQEKYQMNQNYLWMHDLLQEMGRDIVRQECLQDPGKRSRLWLYKDINSVLTENTGTKAIQGIVLYFSEPKKVDWNPEGFSKMQYLKLLKISGVQLIHDLKHLPNSLRYLDWSGCPLKSLPSSFQSNELIELCMRNSNIERLWKGTKSFEKLKFIHLDSSYKLIETPDLTKVPNLEELVLKDCINLLEVHQSIGVHKKLKVLNLEECKNLKSLPSKFEMESLEILILSKCAKVKKIPEFGGNMECLCKLYLDGIAISKLPASIEYLTGLASLILRDCKNLVCLPSTIFNLKLLKEVDISGCSKFERLPEILGNAESVEELDVSGTAVRHVPSSIGRLKNLKRLSFQGCKGLSSSNKSWYERICSYSKQMSPDHVGLSPLLGLCSLTELNLSDCNLKAIPNDIGSLFSLERLILSGNKLVCLPESLGQLSHLRSLNLSKNNLECLPKSLGQLFILMELYVTDCTHLKSLPKLPLKIDTINAQGCKSLEMNPDLLRPNKVSWLHLQNCFKLSENQGLIDYFIAIIKWHSQVSLSLSLSLTSKQHSVDNNFQIVIPGSEIPEWFSHQSMGPEVNIKLHYSHLCSNDVMGFAVCAVFCSDGISYKDINWCFIVNGKEIVIGSRVDITTIASDHILLSYISTTDLKISLVEYDANGFCQIGIIFKIRGSGLDVKKCGLCFLYEEGIEDPIPTDSDSDSDSTLVTEGNKVKRSRDEYDGAGPSGEGSCNDVPRPKRIERPTEFGNSDSEESSEYKDCDEELSDVQ